MKLYAGVHDFIYIDDFVRGIDLLLQQSWPLGEIVNFGSGVQTTNLEVLEVWQQVTGRTVSVEYHDSYLRPQDTKHWQCDTAYARSVYGFQSQFTLTQGVEDFIRKMQ